MKAQNWLPVAASCILLAFSACSQDDHAVNPQSDALAGTGASGTDIYLAPSGDVTGVTDSDAIENALNAVKTTGSTVYLAAGHFYVSRMIQAPGFSGTLQGAGKDNTIIDIVRKGPNDGEGFEFWYDPLDYMYWSGGQSPPPDGDAYPYVFALHYPSGDIAIRDMTIRASDPAPCDPWQRYSHTKTCLETIISIFGTVVPVNTTVENLRLEGAESSGGGFGGLNSTHGMWIIGGPYWGSDLNGAYGHGSHNLTGCEFEKVGGANVTYMVGIWEGSTITVGGPRDDENTFTDVGNTPVRLVLLKDSDLEVTNNTVTNTNPRGFAIVLRELYGCHIQVTQNSVTNSWRAAVDIWNVSGCQIQVSGLETFDASGVWVYNHRDLDPSTITITHNTIRMRPGTDYSAIELWNRSGQYNGQQTMNVTARFNTISSPSHVVPFGPIFSYWVDDALVANNTITGAGLIAVYVGFYGNPGNSWTLLGNNVENFAGVAAIYLGTGTSNCRVVGRASDNVIDAGTNNVLVGVNNMSYKELGQDISDAISQKLAQMEEEGNLKIKP